MTDFEKVVRKALIDKELSIKEFANQLGVSQAYIYDIFKDNRPAKKQRERITSFLNLKEGTT